MIRDIVPDGDALDSVRVFNAMLVGTDLVRQGKVTPISWLKCQRISDMLDLLPPTDRVMTESEEISSAARRAKLDSIPGRFLRPDPITGCHLEPSLLLRHAAGQLYQEAHLQLEREDPTQSLFPGIVPRRRTTELLRPDARFTPTNLARALAQFAVTLRGETHKKDRFEAIDPACGSGVFLQEMMRELEDRNFNRCVTLRGFDTSKISWAMARFALCRTIHEAGADASKRYSVSIEEKDALKQDWGTPDVVLMNPPFVGFREMTDEERRTVVGVLSEATGKETDNGRPDMAMAFCWKAAACLKNAAVMASVLPAPLLENASGVDWRAAMTTGRVLSLVGRFEDYGIFSGAVVEPAVIVIQDAARTKGTANQILVLYARENYKDATIRAAK